MCEGVERVDTCAFVGEETTVAARRQSRSLSELKDNSAQYLTEYTDPAKHYAFRCYDQSPIHDGELTPADVLLANVLSLRLGWSAVTPLFADEETPATQLRNRLNAALTEARRLPSLENCDDVQVEMPALAKANEATDAMRVDGGKRDWTIVTVSKVLHRLTPTVPLIDSHVKRFYAARWAGQIRLSMRDDLVRNHGWLRVLAEQHPVRDQLMPLTRVADIAIWMDATRTHRN